MFTTYERDSESSTDYAMARFYRWLLGRFLSLDPLSGSTADPQSLNRYTYVENNPISNSDPSGACIHPDASTWDNVRQGLVCPPNTTGDYLGDGFGGYEFDNVYVDGMQVSGDLASFLLGSGAAAECPDGGCNQIGNNGLVYRVVYGDEGLGYQNPLNGSVFFDGSELGLSGLGDGGPIGPSGGGPGPIPQPSGPRTDQDCPQAKIKNAIPGANFNNQPTTPHNGHLQQRFSAPFDQLQSALAPFKPFGINNGYRDSSLFISLHVNDLVPSTSPNVQAEGHIDVSNPSTGLLGVLGHVIVDNGIGRVFFHKSPRLDPNANENAPTTTNLSSVACFTPRVRATTPRC